MSLDFQKIPIVFGQGLDTKTDRKMVLPGKLIQLENGVFKNAQSISKRYGYDMLSLSIDGADNISKTSFFYSMAVGFIPGLKQRRSGQTAVALSLSSKKLNLLLRTVMNKPIRTWPTTLALPSMLGKTPVAEFGIAS
jgi:hypothetical protein